MKEETRKPSQATDVHPEEVVSSLNSTHEDTDNLRRGQESGHPAYIRLGSELMRLDISKIRMLYEGLILAAGVWAIVGASDTCKSMVLRQLAMCIAAGKEFLGKKFNGKHRSAIIVCSEDDEESIAFLLKMQNMTLGLSEGELSRIRFIFDTTDLQLKLQEELERCPADLVIIDAFADVFDGKDLNQNNQVRAFINNYANIAKKNGCSLCFLHHTGKRTEELTPSKNNTIGSQGFEAKMRLVVELRIDVSDDSLRHLCIVKGNYLPGEAKNASYVLKKDENLTFIDTGLRVAFEDLLMKKEKGRNDKKRLRPHDFESDEHKNFLLNVYNSQTNNFSGRQLTAQIMRHFGVSDQKARLFVDYYIERKWLIDNSTSYNRKELHINISEMKSLF